MAGRIRNIIIIYMTLCMTVIFNVPVQAAQEPQFRLDMSSLNLQKGTSVNFVISLMNAQGAQVLSIDGIENFDLLSQSQSTSTSIINGVTTYQEDLYYTVMPRNTGQFTLKANIQYDGTHYETNELNVNVSDSAAKTNEELPDLFIKTILSHTEAYLGEKVVVTYELYSRYNNFENFGFTNYTAIDGVIAKDVPGDQLNADYVYLDGIRYAMYEVRQLIIDPLKSGVLTIPSFNFQVNITTNSSIGGGFGGFFNTTTPMYLQTEEKELLVKPLPAEGKPADFSGIVGSLMLNGYYSREEMNYGDSFTLQVTAYGRCNLDGMKNIISGEIPGISVYETQKSTVESVADHQYHVQKAFEVIMVPDKTGSLDVESISIPYFNTITEKYEYAEITGTTISVLGDMPQQNNNGGINNAAVERVTIDQVNYSDTNNGYFIVQLKKEMLYGILTGFAALLVLAVILLLLISNRKKHDPALSAIYKQLKAAKDINEIYNLFNAMIKHCYKLSLKSSSKNAVKSSLPNAELASRIADIMDYMESPEARGDKAQDYLKEKISVVYRSVMKVKHS